MSALARYFHGRGKAVHGYDRTATPLTRALETAGMHVHYQEDLTAIPRQVDLVVYTPAVPATHQELRYLREQEVPVLKRAEVLGLISRHMRTIAIAGTHGKTTTSTITTHLLREGGVDCTAFLGGIAINLGSNFVEGSSDWVVIEADEFDRSFLHLEPELMAITSLDADHLDIYGDAEAMLETGFRAFAKKQKKNGRCWVQAGQVDKLGLAGGSTYGVEAGDYRATNVRVEDGYFVFDYQDPAGQLEALRFPLPGRHNVENATVAIAIARHLGVTDAALRAALASFRGIKRRFELVYRDEETVYFDDYAHHPSELRAAIGAARELFPGRQLTGVFQPHLYTRTRDFAEGFAQALDLLDEVVLLDIYPAREEPIPGVTSAMLRDLMTNKRVRLAAKSDLPAVLAAGRPDVLLTLGAGDISDRVEPIREFLKRRKELV